MKAVGYKKYGTEEQLEVLTVPEPKLKPKQVLVRVHAASVNPVDVKVMTGFFRIVQMRQAFPIIPLLDGAGVIEKVGPNCSPRLQVGDAVYFFNRFPECGAAAELLAIHEELVARKPTRLSFDEAAALPLVGVTSYRALVEHGRVKFGSKVLIVGASGGTGALGVQIAKALGCYVVGVCSGKNAALVTELGADRVIDYTREDWGAVYAQSHEFDMVYDCLGGREVYLKACGVLKPGAPFVTICGDIQPPVSAGRLLLFGPQYVARKLWSFAGSPAYYFFTAWPDRHILDKLTSMVEDGRVRPIIAATYSLEQMREAFHATGSGHSPGKNVIHMNGSTTLSEENSTENDPSPPLISPSPSAEDDPTPRMNPSEEDVYEP